MSRFGFTCQQTSWVLKNNELFSALLRARSLEWYALWEHRWVELKFSFNQQCKHHRVKDKWNKQNKTKQKKQEVGSKDGGNKEQIQRSECGFCWFISNFSFSAISRGVHCWFQGQSLELVRSNWLLGTEAFYSVFLALFIYFLFYVDLFVYESRQDCWCGLWKKSSVIFLWEKELTRMFSWLLVK